MLNNNALNACDRSRQHTRIDPRLLRIIEQRITLSFVPYFIRCRSELERSLCANKTYTNLPVSATHSSFLLLLPLLLLRYCLFIANTIYYPFLVIISILAIAFIVGEPVSQNGTIKSFYKTNRRAINEPWISHLVMLRRQRWRRRWPPPSLTAVNAIFWFIFTVPLRVQVPSAHLNCSLEPKMRRADHFDSTWKKNELGTLSTNLKIESHLIFRLK